MVKTPGMILYESQGSPVPYAELDERVRRQFEMEGAAVWNAALDAALKQCEYGGLSNFGIAALKVQP